MNDAALSIAQEPIPQRGREMEFALYKEQQARISRRRMYPTTAFYTTYSLIILVLALRSPHPFVAVAFYVAGLVFWTFMEYLMHRHVLHHSFPPGKGIIKRFLHWRIDPLHTGHHDEPLDGAHMSGVLSDMIPLFVILAPLSFLAPIYTVPVGYAAFVEGYILEEWLHHLMHYYNLPDSYSRYVKRHHAYHHSPEGISLGYGITSGIWDYVFDTRYPESVRRALSLRTPAPESNGGRRAL